MVLLLARLVLSVLANAIGLLMAAVLLADFQINGLSFVTAVLIFSLATTVLGPLIMKIALRSAPYLLGGIALVTTFVGLLVTNLVTDGLSISGLSTWVVATLVVWVFSVIGAVVLPLVIFKKTLANNNSKSVPALKQN